MGNLRENGLESRTRTILAKVVQVKKEYDFSRAKKNPYTRLLKRQVTIRLDEETVRYFKETAKEAGIPYQTLINLYLRECAASGRKLLLRWRTPPVQGSRSSFSAAR
jgi:predicted DNA binding CopG/RHH family protein